MNAQSAGTTLDATDVVVREQRGSPAGFGRLLNVGYGAVATLTRAVLETSTEFGVFGAEPGTRVSLTDAVVRDIEGRPADGRYGRSVSIERGAATTLSRVRVAGARGVGVMTMIDAPEAALTDVTITDVREQACLRTTCPEGTIGHGVAATDGGRITVSRFEIDRCHTCGVLVGADAEIDLSADSSATTRSVRAFSGTASTSRASRTASTTTTK